MPHNKITFEWLEHNSDIFSGFRSMLYVGWRLESSFWWMDKFGPMIGIERYGLVEAHLPNFKLFPRDIPKYNSRIEDMKFDGDWDMLFWDHGPEHSNDMSTLTEAMEKFKSKFDVILCTFPWGKCPNDNDGNPYEVHNTTIYEEDVIMMGMEYFTFNVKDMGPLGEIVSWWKRER